MSKYEEYVCTYYPDNWGEKYVPHLGEPIVRCRGCKHYEEPQPKNGWNGYCTTKEHDTVPDGFCKWGERRSE